MQSNGWGFKEAVKKHILIIDDDKNMLKILRMFLMDDYQVTIVDSGMKALEFIVKHTPDLVLLDYMMPMYDGPHILEIIRKREETVDLPVLFLTSVTDRGSVMQGLKYKPQGYLIKPISREELLQRVGEVLYPGGKF